MATANFLTFADFKTHTTVTLPRYYIRRGDGYVGNVMGVNETSGVTHVYTPTIDEDLVPTGLGSDVWFAGAIEVSNITSP